MPTTAPQITGQLVAGRAAAEIIFKQITTGMVNDLERAADRAIDFLGKTDGCSSQGTPDHNDWIDACGIG